MPLRAPLAILAAVTCLACLACLACVACASAPAPHPVLAEATPAEAAPPAASSATTTEKPPPLPPVVAKPPPASEHHDRQMNRALGWVAVSIGSAAGAVALGTSYVMLQAQSDRNSGCDAQKMCTQSGLDANARLGQLAGWNAGAWIVAAAGIGTGVFLLLTNPSDKELGTQVGIGPSGSGMGLSLRRGF